MHSEAAPDLQDSRNRIWHTRLGWITRDPTGYPDGLNPYAGYHILHGSVDPNGTSEYSDVEMDNVLFGLISRGFSIKKATLLGGTDKGRSSVQGTISTPYFWRIKRNWRISSLFRWNANDLRVIVGSGITANPEDMFFDLTRGKPTLSQGAESILRVACICDSYDGKLTWTPVLLGGDVDDSNVKMSTDYRDVIAVGMAETLQRVVTVLRAYEQHSHVSLFTRTVLSYDPVMTVLSDAEVLKIDAYAFNLVATGGTATINTEAGSWTYNQKDRYIGMEFSRSFYYMCD